MHKAFKNLPLNLMGEDHSIIIGLLFDELLTKLDTELIPEGRERSLMVTKLEEACFFAKKAMALQSKNSLDDLEECD